MGCKLYCSEAADASIQRGSAEIDDALALNDAVTDNECSSRRGLAGMLVNYLPSIDLVIGWRFFPALPTGEQSGDATKNQSNNERCNENPPGPPLEGSHKPDLRHTRVLFVGSHTILTALGAVWQRALQAIFPKQIFY